MPPAGGFRLAFLSARNGVLTHCPAGRMHYGVQTHFSPASICRSSGFEPGTLTGSTLSGRSFSLDRFKGCGKVTPETAMSAASPPATSASDVPPATSASSTSPATSASQSTPSLPSSPASESAHPAPARAVEQSASVQAPRVRVGHVAVQGLREEMEDEVMVKDDVAGGFLCAGVFDGHAGHAASKYLSEHLQALTLSELDGGKTLSASSDAFLNSSSEAMTSAFRRADEELCTWLQQQPPSQQHAGSTATLVFASQDRILVASVGDSRAVLCSGESGEDVSDLTVDHRPHGGSQIAEDEVKRIKDEGGWVSQGRLCGSLAVSRAFGNPQLKKDRTEWLLNGVKQGRWTTRFVNKLNPEGDWLSIRPHVHVSMLPPSPRLLVIASDGLWDVVRSSEAVRHVQDRLKEHDDIQRAAEELADFALTVRKSDDNLSIVLVAF